MKKNVLTLLALALIAIQFIAGCKKTDSKAPEIALNGGTSQTVSLQSTYNEQGASAQDEEDGDIVPVITGSVNVNHKGVYTIYYRATDKSGNINSVTRTVTVINDSDAITGTYSCTISPSNVVYTQMVTASADSNNRINFSRFGNYLHNSTIHANFSGSNILLPKQFAIQIDSIPNIKDRTFWGSGSATSGGFTLTYTDSTANAANVIKTETFVKQ